MINYIKQVSLRDHFSRTNFRMFHLNDKSSLLITINTRFLELSSSPGTENAIGAIKRSREFSPATEAKEFEKRCPGGIPGSAPPVSVYQIVNYRTPLSIW